MNLTLSTVEVRILGCLIEKQATTPDAYPLTLNGLVAACNQKSSREPVTNLDESEVLSALDTLMENKLASTHQSGRKEARYAHLFCGEVKESISSDLSGATSAATGNPTVEKLELQVNALREKLVDLENRFDKFVDQFK